MYQVVSYSCIICILDSITENSNSGSKSSRKRPAPSKTNSKAKRLKALDKELQSWRYVHGMVSYLAYSMVTKCFY